MCKLVGTSKRLGMTSLKRRCISLRKRGMLQFFLDKSTEVVMKTCPEYFSAIGITNKFQWMVCFIGQIDIGGCESGEVYYNKIKHVFSEYETL